MLQYVNINFNASQISRDGSSKPLEKIPTFNRLEDFFQFLIELGEYDSISVSKTISAEKMVMGRLTR